MRSHEQGLEELVRFTKIVCFYLGEEATADCLESFCNGRIDPQELDVRLVARRLARGRTVARFIDGGEPRIVGYHAVTLSQTGSRQARETLGREFTLLALIVGLCTYDDTVWSRNERGTSNVPSPLR